ncbi:hypothetical protein BIV24_18025 [Streptomyces colonosanans]|uniref:Uncharacterized protein n=1 Tax=Streptomyces colonosanans TaxID=1428652 RepID=A0A1S2PBW9_9ACTN|nr:hypothetical protein BIV24_18025 [Streptomyces colonosanans]
MTAIDVSGNAVAVAPARAGTSRTAAATMIMVMTAMMTTERSPLSVHRLFLLGRMGSLLEDDVLISLMTIGQVV